MVLISNPPIKPDTMLMVQVIRNYQKMNEILNQSYAEKNNFFKYHCKTESGTESVKRVLTVGVSLSVH